MNRAAMTGWAELLACCAIAAALRLWCAGLPMAGPDEGLYVLTAQLWRGGALPYVALWDHHPPALPALLAVAGQLGLAPLATARLTAGVAVAVTAWLLAKIGRAALGDPAAGWVAGLAYLLATAGRDGQQLSTELIDNLLTTSAACLMLAAGPRTGRAGLVGLLFGAALMVKFVAAAHAVLLACAWLQARVPAALALLAGLLLPTAGALMYFQLHGALPDLLDATIAANLAYVGDAGDPRTLVRFKEGLRMPSGTLAGLVGVLLTPNRRARRFLALWLLASVIALLMPGKFWRHHFLVLLPPLCLGCGWPAPGLPPARGAGAA